MSSRRKADLQRKLSLASVPRPPEDLLERIKGDIPQYLQVESERARFTRTLGSHWKIAASIIFLFGSTLALLYVLAPEMAREKMAVSIASDPVLQRELAPATATASEMASAPATALDTVQVDIAQQQAAPAGSAAAAPPPTVQVAFADLSTARRSDAAANTAMTRREESPAALAESRPAGGVSGGVPAPVFDAVEEISVTAAAPMPAPAPVAPPAPPASPAEPMAAPQRAERTATAASALMAVAKSSADAAPKSVFGFSIDPDAFRRVKSAIEQGSRPAAESVDVEALINYFAGMPARRAAGGVRMEVEASPAPVESEGSRGILRVTIDTGSLPGNAPAGRDARLEIVLNASAVAEIKPIGDAFASAQEAVLPRDISVTGLYALDLKEPVRARDTVATIRLSYRDVIDGKRRTITRILHGSDFAKQWSRSSRRHRLASLGALWGESLRTTGRGTDVAKRAEELASQEPTDVRAQELAAAATASSGGGSR